MESKIDLLTQKVYAEGVEKAKADSEQILADAMSKAKGLVQTAEKKAEDTVLTAEKKAKNLETKVRAEMAFSAEQAITGLKQQITQLLSVQIAADLAKGAMSDKDLVAGIMQALIEKWDVGTSAPVITLPENKKDEYEKALKGKVKEALAKSLEVKTSASLKSGFTIAPKDGSFVINFSDEAFNDFFQALVKPFTKSVLFEK